MAAMAGGVPCRCPGVTPWIALLRGINVGGRTMLPMQGLREVVEQLGYGSVRTYLQSGNLVFRAARGDPAGLAAEIGAGIDARFGFQPAVFVLTPAELEAALAANPFPQAEDPKSVHLFFMARPAPHADLPALRALAVGGEAVVLTERVLYTYTPAGIGRSKMAARIGHHIPVEMTARNLRTATKLAELATSIA